VLFDRVLRDLNQQRAPFFSTVFTLSSHEPFDVPGQPRFHNKNEPAFFRNSVAYTDHVPGRFLQQARHLIHETRTFPPYTYFCLYHIQALFA
jgi:phosphoglycerol transferase MdoB-like AlkP superfamily enzyme